jgi:hypothetical protein
VCDALMAQLSILIFQYLSCVGLMVHDVLEVRLICLQLIDLCLKICQITHTYYNKYSAALAGDTHLFFWRNDLFFQINVPLCLHLLYLVMVLSEGAMELGLEQRGVLLELL